MSLPAVLDVDIERVYSSFPSRGASPSARPHGSTSSLASASGDVSPSRRLHGSCASLKALGSNASLKAVGSNASLNASGSNASLNALGDASPSPSASAVANQVGPRTFSAPSSALLQTAARSDVAYWSHEMSYSSLASTDAGYTQQPWLPDELALHCMACRRPFHLLRWTHHCRNCGGVFCDACTTHRVEADESVDDGKQYNEPPIRLCDGCAFSAQHQKHLGCRNPIGCPRCGTPA